LSLTTITTFSEEETRAAARTFGTSLQRGDVVALYGDLGAGKTQFVKGLCEAFGVRQGVTSPTFVILHRYEGRDQFGREILLYHFDLYRVTGTSELYDVGYEEFLYGDGICCIEWAERMKELLPPKRYDVWLSLGDAEDERRIEIERVVPTPVTG
jgi:tRNA threonylcarbamoyladenosine biosynthesis protein TsaE